MRTQEEIREKPDIIPEKTNYINIPMFDNRMTGITHEKTSRLEQLKHLDTMENVYKEIIVNENYIDNISKIIKEIINSNNYPILYHCSEGKDRTGIITMLILYILNFDEKTILREYLYINRINKFKSVIYYLVVLIMLKNKKLANKARMFKIAHKDYLYKAIDTINEEYGSVDNYINTILNVSKEEIESFKMKVLEI